MPLLRNAPLCVALCISGAAHAEAIDPDARDIIVTGKALSLTSNVVGQTHTAIPYAVTRDTIATTIADIVKFSPGVTIIQGNGPRDVGVSIRGSNARNSFGARNIQVFEDDFPVTQPDGLARFDLTDPHAYGTVYVVRGPSSARYGNYALGGAINFHTRSGREVDGLDAGFDAGGYGYRNLYATLGLSGPRHDVSLFGSFVHGDGSTGHSGYDTGTINLLATQEISPGNRLTAKFIYNKSVIDLPIRLSANQFAVNPYQQGCGSSATTAPGCASINFKVNGQTVTETAQEGGLGRVDQRAIAGLRFEHDLSKSAVWRIQGTVDSRVVFQPTNGSPFKGALNSYNLSTDVTTHDEVAGMQATSFVGVFYNYLDNRSYTYVKAEGGRYALGPLSQTVFGSVRNMGLRAREELTISPRWQLVAGIGAEDSVIDVIQTASTVIPARRHFWNVAPEAALYWRALDALRLHARVGTGYGIPQAGNLFVTQAGAAGNNTGLKAQKNLGADLGAEIAISHSLKAEVTGYYEWFRNELVTQSAGVNLLSYTSNVPRSRHRGVDVGLDWKPLKGVSLIGTYSFTDQRYTNFQETLAAGSQQATLSRNGNAIPGAIPTFANVRIGYDQPSGKLSGLGGFIEATHRSSYFIDNANLLKLPAYTLVNLNVHYDAPAGHGWLSRVSLYVTVQNLTDKTYVGSAGIVSDSLNSTTGVQNGLSTIQGVTGSLYAGTPRTVFGGIKVHLQ